MPKENKQPLQTFATQQSFETPQDIYGENISLPTPWFQMCGIMTPYSAREIAHVVISV